MRRFITHLVWLAVIAAVAIAAAVWITRSDQANWPTFQTSSQTQGAQAPEDSNAPLVVTRVERDYGWRTADVIQILIYIEQKPGTSVDLHSLAIDGDFDVVGEPSIMTRDLKDGHRLIAIRLKVQSMKVASQLKLSATMLYHVSAGSEDRMITIPAFQPYTSKTWDGRNIIQDGDPHTMYGLPVWLPALMILGGILAMVVLSRLRRQWLAEDEALVDHSPRGWTARALAARRDFDAVWARFDNGDFSEKNYREIARIVRKLFSIESKIHREIEIELGQGHPYLIQTLIILDLCGKVTYRQEVLKEKEQLAIKSTFDQIVPPTTSAPGE